MGRKYIVRFRSTYASAEEYWMGEPLCQRKYQIYAVTTCNIEMAKFFSSERVAQKSADILNAKCANKGWFDVVQMGEKTEERT